MRVIFLDFDGVLNGGWREQQEAYRKRRGY